MARVDYVALDLVPDGAWAGVRELCGHDEETVGDTRTTTALRLLDRLLVDDPTTDVDPGDAACLTASDRDRLLVTVYVRTYGPDVESTVRCRTCETPFDVDFALSDLMDTLAEEAHAADVTRHDDQTFTLPEGTRFRAPTGEDELAVWRLPPEEAERQLIARCLIEGETNGALEAVQAALDVVAPVLDLDLDARCPECRAEQAVHFDLQSYLLGALLAERDRRLGEVHRLARAYGWSLEEILGLPRSERRRYVALIEAETETARSRWP